MPLMEAPLGPLGCVGWEAVGPRPHCGSGDLRSVAPPSGSYVMAVGGAGVIGGLCFAFVPFLELLKSEHAVILQAAKECLQREAKPPF